MAEGGEHEIPWDWDIGRDGDDADAGEEGGTWPPPTSTSTPGRPVEEILMNRLPPEQSGLPDTSYDESTPLLDSQSRVEAPWNTLTSLYPDASAIDLETFRDPKGRLKVKMAGVGKKSYYLFTTQKGTKELHLNPDLTKEIERSLGPKAQDVLTAQDREIREMRQEQRGAQKELNKVTINAAKFAAQRTKNTEALGGLSRKIEQTKARIAAIREEQHGQSVESESNKLSDLEKLLKNLEGDFEIAKTERTALQKLEKQTTQKQKKVDNLNATIAAEVKKKEVIQERLNNTKSLDELKNQEAEIERQIAEDREVIEDQATSQSDREAAEGRIEGHEEERASLRAQIEGRERTRSLMGRLKEIFKKYGMTVTAVLLAAGTVIGAIVGAITNSLKSVAKGLGNGLKALGKKLGSLLPGLIGAIVSFIFKAAGQALGFLAEHTWLLILAAVAFLIEKVLNKKR